MLSVSKANAVAAMNVLNLLLNGLLGPPIAQHRRQSARTLHAGTILLRARCRRSSEVAMRVFLGMILGALLLTVGVYIRDSMSTSTVASGQVAQVGRTIVNWDVAATDWNALKTRAHDDWIKLSSK
jgi:hypothetical protein